MWIDGPLVADLNPHTCARAVSQSVSPRVEPLILFLHELNPIFFFRHTGGSTSGVVLGNSVSSSPKSTLKNQDSR